MFIAETKRYIKIGLIAVVLVLFVKYFSQISSTASLFLNAASPLLVGCIMAYILNILLTRIEKWYFPFSNSKLVCKTRRPVCLVLSFVLLALIIYLVLQLIVPELLSSFALIGKEIPPLMEKFRAWLLDQSVSLPALQQIINTLDIDWQNLLQRLVSLVTTGAEGVITSVVSVISATFSVLTRLVIGLIFALYLLVSKERLQSLGNRILRAYIKPHTRETISYVLDTANKSFSSFIVGQCTEAVILGTLCTVGMLIFRFPYAAMTGTVVGVTALIPIVGAYIGAVVGGFMIFTQDPIQALLFLVFLVVLQQLEGNLIYPRVVGTSIGLPGIWVLAAVTIGGGAAGISGMLLGVPLAATLYRLLNDSVDRHLPPSSTQVAPSPAKTSPTEEPSTQPQTKPQPRPRKKR